MNQFKYHWEARPPLFTVTALVLEGTLDRSIDPLQNPDIKQLAREFDANSNGKLIIVDVQKLDFWDTEGVEAIVEQVIQPAIKKNGAKVGFSGKRVFLDRTGKQESKQVFDEARLKYGEIGVSIPWEDTEEKTVQALRRL